MQIKILIMMLIATNCLMGSNNDNELPDNKSHLDCYNTKMEEEEEYKEAEFSNGSYKVSKNKAELLQNCTHSQQLEITKRPELLKLSSKQFKRLLRITCTRTNPFYEEVFEQDRPEIYKLFAKSQKLLDLKRSKFDRLLKLIDDKDGEFYSTKEELELFNENQHLLRLNYMEFKRLEGLLPHNSTASKKEFLRFLSEDSSILNIKELEFKRLLSIIKTTASNTDDISTEGCPNVSGVIKFLSKNKSLLSDNNCELWIKLLRKSHKLIL